MDQDNTPKFENEPFQPPEPAAQPTSGGAQVYEPFTPPPPAPGESFTPPPAYVPPAPPKSNNRKIWTIVLIVLLVLCCCCVITLVAANYAYNNGDAFIIEMCRQDPTLQFCP